jgi:hypothetical protein
MPIWALWTVGSGLALWTVGSIERGLERGVQDGSSRIVTAALIVGGVYLVMKKGK